jgi:hypothetical protein
LKISNIQLLALPEGMSELSAEVSIEKPRPESYRIWFRGPQGCFGDAPLGDIYFTAFWIPAMFLQEPFEIDGEISKELLDTAYGNLEPIFLRWFPRDLAPARVQGARVIESPAPPSTGVGCMFSGGLDSSYSIAKHCDSLTHLIFIRGFDFPWDQDERAEHALAGRREGARDLGKELIVLHSNLGDPIVHLTMRSPELGRPRRAFHSEMYFGSMLVAFSRCLRGLLGEVFIPASWTYEYMTPKGSHPLVEPNWSTSTMKFRLDGCEADRVDKAKYIVDHNPALFRSLRVCTESHGGAVPNCGQCVKCIKTMIEMRLVGASDEAYSSFDHPLDLDFARGIWWGNDTGLLSDTLHRARAVGDADLTRVLEIALRRRFDWSQFKAWWRHRWQESKNSRIRAREKRRFTS